MLYKIEMFNDPIYLKKIDINRTGRYIDIRKKKYLSISFLFIFYFIYLFIYLFLVFSAFTISHFTVLCRN